MAEPPAPHHPPADERWLVTGGAGFFGRALVARLLAAGVRPRVLDTAPENPYADDARVEYVRADVRDAAAVHDASREVDVVVHAAAALPIHRSRRLIWDVNVNGMRNVLASAAARGVRAVSFISSTAVYGLHKVHPILEDSPVRPVGPYGESKVEAERLCRDARAGGLHVSILRCKTFLGPGRLGVFEILFDWIRRGKRIYLIGSGHNKYQLLHVDDLIDALLLGIERPEGNDDFNLGATEFGSLREDLAPVLAEAASGARFAPVPALPAKTALYVLDKLHLSPLTLWHYGTMDKHSYVETAKARARLGWAPRHSNQDTLVEAYRWYLDHVDEVTGRVGDTHTVPWRQGALKWLRRIS